MYWGKETSTRLTSSAQVSDHHVRVIRVVVEAVGGAVGYVKLYDNTSATGTPAWQIAVPAEGGWTRQFIIEQDFVTGVYAELSNAYITLTYA